MSGPGGVGHGCYGTVFKAIDKQTGQLVALKKVKIPFVQDGPPISFYRELTALQALHDANIVRYIDTVKDDDYTLYLVLEYCEFDLAGLIHGPYGSYLEQDHVISYMKQLLHAVSLIHENSFAHRDLKPSNIYVTRDNVIKVGDFGLTRKIPPKGLLSTNVTTACYKPPEVLLGDNQYDFGVDVWSLGCIFYEMITGEVLFNSANSSDIQQLQKIFEICGLPSEDSYLSTLPNYSLFAGLCQNSTGNLNDYLLTHIDPAFIEIVPLLEKMLTLDPKERISINECLAHSFFAGDDTPLPYLDLPERHAADVNRLPISKAKIQKKMPFTLDLLRAGPLAMLAF